MPASAEQSLKAEEKKQRFLGILSTQSDFSPLEAAKEAQVGYLSVTGWLNTDGEFRDRYSALKRAWIAEITDKAVKTVAFRMFDKGKEWLLIQWLKVHDPEWRNASRAQVNQFAQINMISVVRGGQKQVKAKDDQKDALALPQEERDRMRLDNLRPANAG